MREERSKDRNQRSRTRSRSRRPRSKWPGATVPSKSEGSRARAQPTEEMRDMFASMMDQFFHKGGPSSQMERKNRR